MSKHRLHIDEVALARLVEPVRQRMEQQANEVLQSAIREVRDEMEGADADEIYETLLGRLSSRIAGFQPNEKNFREYALVISERRMKD